MKFSLKLYILSSIIISSLLLTGCTSTISENIDKHGKVSIDKNGKLDKLIWSDMDDAFIKNGTYPTKDQLSLIAPGLSKDDLYAIFGPPHQQEGFFGVREWEYIFKFRQEGTAEPKICQYKVIFDKDYIAQSFYWHPKDCGENMP